MAAHTPVHSPNAPLQPMSEDHAGGEATLAPPSFSLAASSVGAEDGEAKGGGALQRKANSEGVVQRNIMDLSGSTAVHGRSGAMSETQVREVQQRLIDIGLLDESHEGDGWSWGRINSGDEAAAAIRTFQEQNAAEIGAIEAANDQVLALDAAAIARAQRALAAVPAAPATPPTTEEGRRTAARNAAARERHQSSISTGQSRRRRLDAVDDHRDGAIAADDPTHQLLANAWPRRIAGVLLENETAGYNFIAGQVQARDLPFDENRVNVVGIRGLSGGVANGNPGARRRANTFNDTFFVLARDEQGVAHMREFPGTTDPGGRRSARGGQDADTYMMDSDQQLPYWFNTVDRSKLGRTTLVPMTGGEGHGTVRDVPRSIGDSGMDVPDPSDEVAVEEILSSGNLAILRAMYGTQDGRRASEDRTYMEETLRTTYGTDGELRGRRRGIAMHSSNGGDQVNADSTGCQVIHGNWYGDYTMTLQRALCWERLRRIQSMSAAQRAALPRNFIPRTGQELVDQGAIIYSLIDARTMVADVNNPPESGA